MHAEKQHLTFRYNHMQVIFTVMYRALVMVTRLPN